MPLKKHYIIFFILWLVGTSDTLAQLRKAPRRIIRKIEKYSCPIVTKADARHGLGIKLGDPIGISYKTYFLDRMAFEVVAGIPTGGLYANFIQDEFNETDVPGFEGDSLLYISHEIGASAAVQARVLLHNPLPSGITGETGVDWYIGLGLSFRYLDVDYVFQNVESADPTDFELGEAAIDYILIGPEFTLGFEYALSNFPVTAFFEGNAFYDTGKVAAGFRFYGGLGLRYNF
jgi:hypothetical protein